MLSTLISHDYLVQRASRWIERQGYGVVLSEYVTVSDEIPDAIGFGKRDSVVVECKVSRSDFRADQRKTHRHAPGQLGNYRYYLVLPHIMAAEETPDGWGLLYAFDKSIRHVKTAPLHNEPEIRVAEYSLLYSMARRIVIRGLLPQILKPLEVQ